MRGEPQRVVNTPEVGILFTIVDILHVPRRRGCTSHGSFTTAVLCRPATHNLAPVCLAAALRLPPPGIAADRRSVTNRCSPCHSFEAA